MRGVALAGVIATSFGVAAYYATGHFGAFSGANIVLGVGALVVALASAARRLRSAGGPHARRVIARGLLLIAGALALAVFMERAAARSGVRLDWTGEGRYELADATREAVSQMCGPLEILLFHDPLDPRIRRTRLLLSTLARLGDATLREFDIEQSPKVVDTYGIGSSNSVVLRTAGRDEVVERRSTACARRASGRSPCCAAKARATPSAETTWASRGWPPRSRPRATRCEAS
jgi:hypothetical protein